MGTLLSFLFFTAVVAAVAWWRTRRDDHRSRDGYFLAGRGLSGWVIAGSMLMTNLSAEHMVGLNGQAYRTNLSSMAWETTPAVATVVMALVFLPRYLRGAFTTLPEFFEDRYDGATRRAASCLLLFSYVVIALPAGCLYPGAVAVNRIFDVPALLGISPQAGLWVSVWFIGLVGAAYAVFGGLRAVAISDTANGVGLLIGGLLVPVFGLLALGGGDLAAGLRSLVESAPEKLNAIGSASDPVPFGTIFTGMILAHLFYWGTNQAVIQRCLGARSLAEGQKGVLLSGFFKILVPLVMLVPGVIAWHLLPGLENPDHAYPALVAAVFPKALIGFFAAVLFGAVLSTYDSILNSAATLFCLDIYKPLFRPSIDDASLIRIAKRVTVAMAVVTMCVAPFTAYATEGLYQFVRRATGFYNIPMIALVLLGFATRRTSGLAARIALGAYLVAYVLVVFVFGEPIHFIHIMGLLFLGMVAIALVVSRFAPRPEPYVMRSHEAAVDLAPWPLARPFSVLLMAMLVLVYLVCSPIGLASAAGPGVPFAASVAAVLLAAGAALVVLRRRRPANHGSSP
jgi:SSS family solute:Na+ symporter